MCEKMDLLKENKKGRKRHNIRQKVENEGEDPGRHGEDGKD